MLSESVKFQAVQPGKYAPNQALAPFSAELVTAGHGPMYACGAFTGATGFDVGCEP